MPDQRVADRLVIDDAFLRYAKPRYSTHMGLDLTHRLSREPLQARQSVGGPAFFQISEPGHLAFVHGHHQLATDLVRDIVCLTESHHLADARNCQPRFGGTRLIVQPTVKHATVVTGLMPSDLFFLLKHGRCRAGEPLDEAIGRSQSYDPAADDQETPPLRLSHLIEPSYLVGSMGSPPRWT